MDLKLERKTKHGSIMSEEQRLRMVRMARSGRGVGLQLQGVTQLLQESRAGDTFCQGDTITLLEGESGWKSRPMALIISRKRIVDGRGY